MTPPYIDGIDIAQKFTSEQIFDMHRKGQLRAITLNGYVTRVDILDDTISFVPFWESSKFRDEQGTMKMTEFGVENKRKELEHDHPITRSTPQEKVARLAMRLLAEAKRSGRVTGLSDDEHAAILGESWRSGSPLTGSDIEKLSQWFMQRAEVDNREADRHRVTQLHKT
jgi:hypothetical protein